MYAIIQTTIFHFATMSKATESGIGGKEMLNWKTMFRRMIIIGAPLLLGGLDLWHPESVVFGEMLVSPAKADWWLKLHLMQLPLFGLLAASLYFVTDPISGILKGISRVALWLFIIFYTALDSIAGIATGIIIHRLQIMGITNEGSPAYGSMFNVFTSIFNLDAPGVSAISRIAVYSWTFAGLSAAVALFLKGYNRIGVILIAISALTYQSHAYPNGPITMLLYIAGVICVEFFPWAWTEVKKVSGMMS
ncbi:hypothetical protein O9H85_32305 [Paenibacillus filicis]|uniref:DUF4386 domain-containing protein n=1 Tax=Paenibacillus gyeongsangnamensis TaxID=3388067 RepID=A0ABT4QJE3_9BACL|nr:hypothetical protein [Paenibacillus filicis]MCZ8516959.1 hypothetical protein [Paenibacillus filicis]